MQLPGGNQHHIPDSALFDPHYADAMNADRRADRGLMHRAEAVVLGAAVAVVLAIVGWMALA